MHPCIHSSSEPADVKLQRAQASESAVTVGSVISMEDVMIWVDNGRYRYMQICMDKVDKVRQPTCSSQLLQLRSRSQLTPNRSLLDCFRFNGPSNRHVLWTRLVEKRDAKCASESPLRCKKHVNSMEASNQKSAIWTIGVLWRPYRPYSQFSVICR